MMHAILFCFCCTLFLYSTVSAKSLQFISASGSTKSPSQIVDFLAQTNVKVEKGLFVVDCTPGCSSLINRLFKIEITSESGLILDKSDNLAVLYANFDSMYSNEFCGSKAADFCCSSSFLPCIILKAAEAESGLEAYDQVFRRLYSFAVDRGGKAMDVIIVLASAGTAQQSDSIEDSVISRIRSIASDFNENPFEKFINLKVVRCVEDDEDSLMATTESLQSTAGPLDINSDTVKSLLTNWNSILKSDTKPILSNIQKTSIFRVEMAYTNSLRSADRIIFGWQKRASQGKLIGNFALRVNELLESTRLEFLSSTIGTSVVRERNERLNQVSKHIVDQCEIIYRQQVSTLSSTLLRKFKKELLKNFNSYEDQSKVSEENNNTLRKIIFDFRASAASLEDEKLGFDSSIALNQLSSILEETLKEFPETSAAKLSELKKIENQARRPIKKKRNSRAVNIALSLVGMFRPPGRGSLQGFAGYSTSLLGMPFDLLFGVQNDGDSPEIMGDDREYPILRLQPKVNFDLDL